MATRAEREKSKKKLEQAHAILTHLLREDDNKYCADCEAKAPRWAAWNLGIFICIRCAGIHRNLGVHISRVKSVNLDQWTIEQLESMQAMGNTNARRIYEARLPEEFRRPQTDYSVESFIRNKYERKKYIDVTFDPSSLKNSKEIEKSRMVEWEEKENLQENPVVFEKVKIKAMERQKEQQQNVDLLSLADSQASREQSPRNGDDFGPMLSNPLPVTENMRMPEPLEVEGVEGVRKKPLSKASILSLYGPQGGHGYLRSVHHSMPPLVYPVFSPGPISPHAVATPQPHPLAHSAQLGNLIPAGAFYAGQMPGQGWVCPTLGSSYFMGPATTYSSLATNVGQVSQQLSRLNVSTSQGMMLQGQRPGLFAGSWEMTHNTSTSRGTPSWK